MRKSSFRAGFPAPAIENTCWEEDSDGLQEDIEQPEQQQHIGVTLSDELVIAAAAGSSHSVVHSLSFLQDQHADIPPSPPSQQIRPMRDNSQAQQKEEHRMQKTWPMYEDSLAGQKKNSLQSQEEAKGPSAKAMREHVSACQKQLARRAVEARDIVRNIKGRCSSMPATIATSDQSQLGAAPWQGVTAAACSECSAACARNDGAKLNHRQL